MATSYYELLTILPGTLSDEEAIQAGETVRKHLEKYSATIMKHMVWERRKLAYPINKVKQGVYFLTEFDMDPANVPALDRELHLEKAVLRHQLIKAYRKSAKQLEQEARNRSAATQRQQHQTTERAAEPEAAPISSEKLEEKLEEILTEDMTK